MNSVQESKQELEAAIRYAEKLSRMEATTEPSCLDGVPPRDGQETIIRADRA